MILVDIIVYAQNRTYDFLLDETASVSAVIEEVAEILSRREQGKKIENFDGMMLLTNEGKILPRNYTLSMCNIKTGNSLILI